MTLFDPDASSDLRGVAILPVSSFLEAGARELHLYAGAEAVFWETASRTSFASAAELRAYRRMYFDYYWYAAPELFLPATRPDDATARPETSEWNPAVEAQVVIGYVCAVADTRSHPELYQLAPHLSLFDDLYDEFPAHLHINLTAAGRGVGLGSRLIEVLEDRLQQADLEAPGLHLVTSEGARNVSFYRRNGFTREVARALPAADEREGNHHPGSAARLLFMGKPLGKR
ncbi:MAG: GNAT family N-acetyltransferase [bacterium]